MDYCFVVGSARSGTSILGELIASHPEVKYIFEAHSIWEIAGAGINDGHRYTADYATDDVKEQIRNWFQEQSQSAAMVVEKNPRNILRVPFIRALFPEAKIIHIVRDGRDVACSMVPGCGRDHWSHLKPPSWKEFFSEYSGAERCAMAWKEIMEIGMQDLSGISHLQVKYEDIVASPDLVAKKIFAYMELDLHPMVSEFCNQITNNTNNSYHAKYQNQWSESDHESRVGRWRYNLTKVEQEKIGAILQPLLVALEYPIDQE